MAALDQSPPIICSIVQEEIGNQSCRPARRELTYRRSVIGFGCVLPIARLALVGASGQDGLLAYAAILLDPRYRATLFNTSRSPLASHFRSFQGRFAGSRDEGHCR